ncbi:MAG: HEAT repeat domain-containing protein [Candidatus Hermodarchaeota archaeon]
MDSSKVFLLRALLSENEETRRKARDEIIQHGSAMLPFLIQATKSKDPNIRWLAIDSLGSIQNKNATATVLERALFDDDIHVRWRSVWAITRLDNDSVVPYLLKMIKGSDKKVRWNAAIILSVFGRVEACPILLNGLKSQSEFQRWEAVNALGTVYNSETIPALVNVLEKGNNDIRREAVLSLGRIASEKVIMPLLTALKRDKDPEVRWRAAMALDWTGNKDLIPILHGLMLTEVVESVKTSILKAIKSLELRQS